MRALVFTIAFLSGIQLQAQRLEFAFTYNGMPLQLEQPYAIGNSSDSILFEKVAFYMSAPTLLTAGAPATVANTYHLLDAGNANSMSFELQQTGFDRLAFLFGVDSITSTSGVFGGSLDPTNGMYWTWQSGYIFLKLEGRSNRCTARNNRFQFHIGGYQHPHRTQQQVLLPVGPAEVITVEIPLEVVFDEIDLAEDNAIMSPGTAAVTFANDFIQSFRIAQ